MESTDSDIRNWSRLTAPGAPGNDCLRLAAAVLESSARLEWKSLDYYWKKETSYPMATANFLRAAGILEGNPSYAETGKRMRLELLDLARRTANLRGEFRHTNWGLPFPWPTLAAQRESGNRIFLAGDFFWDEANPLFVRDYPAHLGDAVTSSLMGEGLIDAYMRASDPALRDLIESLARWIVEECGYRRIHGRVFFNYSPAMRHTIYNGSALATAFVARAAHLLERSDWAALAASSMELLLDTQLPDGGWIYAVEKPDIEYHYGYILESFALVHSVAPDARLREKMITAADFYWRELFDPDGRAYNMVGKESETRLWAYGWALSAFVLTNRETGESRYLDYARTVAEYMIRHLWMPEAGFFRFKKNDPGIYLRDQAHAAFGLALLGSST